MTEINEALEKLITALSEDSLFIEFEKARDLVINDEYIQKTETTLKELQQKMTQNVMNNKAHTKYKKEYETLKKKYDEHPYVLNYNALLSEVNDMLLTLKTIIE